MLFKKYKKAFTLVELIIGIAVMGTIASFSTASYMGYKDMADKEQGKLDIQQVKNAVDNFYSTNQKYPTKPITKQPTPDVKDSTGKVVFEGYSKVDVDELVNQRYLQAVPKLKNGQYFAVNFNGVVSIKEGFSESVVVDNGNSLVDTKVNDLVQFEVFTGIGCSEITIYETDKNYTKSGSGIKFNTKPPFKEDEYELYTGQVKVSNSQGQKYFVVKIRYNDGAVVELRTSFQYALAADKVNGDVYWINTAGVDQSTDAGKATNEILNGSNEVSKVGTGIKLNWTNKELASGASAVKYEIEKYVYNPSGKTESEQWIPAPDSPIVTGNTEYLDNAVNSKSTYRYNIYAYSASKNPDGSNKKTLNSLEAKNIKPNAYTDTQSYIENITRNDFNTAYNKNVSVRAGDIDDGIMQMTLFVAKVEKGKVGAFKPYKMNKTPDGTSTVIDEGKRTVITDVYTVPIEVEDDYMIYYIEAIDGRGVATYCYMNPNLTKGDKESDTSFEQRRQVISSSLPSNISESCYTLMRGLVEIFHDSYIDDTKIDVPNSDFHLHDGKVTLP